MIFKSGGEPQSLWCDRMQCNVMQLVRHVLVYWNSTPLVHLHISRWHGGAIIGTVSEKWSALINVNCVGCHVGQIWGWNSTCMYMCLQIKWWKFLTAAFLARECVSVLLLLVRHSLLADWDDLGIVFLSIFYIHSDWIWIHGKIENNSDGYKWDWWQLLGEDEWCFVFLGHKLIIQLQERQNTTTPGKIYC